MPALQLIALALALAMDALAVALASGAALGRVSLRQSLRLGWHFGFFQALMPVLGWWAGLTVRTWIQTYDHWLAFVLLALVGARMIHESLGPNQEGGQKPSDPTRGLSLVMLSLATSLDALAVGLSLAVLEISIWLPVVVIGLVAGVLTGLGLPLGARLGSLPAVHRYAGLLGGLVLWAIGISILAEHGVFN